jgi:multiple antibiotic resistance protein
LDEKALHDAITLLVMVNPIGAAVLYLSFTQGMEKRKRLAIARRACTIAAVILIAFIVVGEVLLDGIGVKLTAFRVAGGLVLLLVGLRRVLGDDTRPAAQDPADNQDVSIFPLATPILAGPGSIIAAVLLTENDRFSIGEQAITGAIVLAIFALTYLTLVGADRLQRVVGRTGGIVMSRVLGLVLCALAMQTMLDGLKPYFQSLR